MKPKWRYNIRLAERKGVTVREAAPDDLPEIQRLLAVTGERDGFGVHSPAYYARATDLFLPAGLAAWLVAEHEGRMLAAIAVFALGRMAWYMWGASGEEGRNLMPNHALQWAAMRWARARGCTIYDLWGIPDEVGETRTPTQSRRAGAKAACGASTASSRVSAGGSCATPAHGICRCRGSGMRCTGWRCGCDGASEGQEAGGMYQVAECHEPAAGMPQC